MANYRLVSIDAEVRLTLSTAASAGQAPSWEITPLVLGGTRRKVAIRDAARTVDVAGGGDLRESHRVHRGGTEITIDKAVLDSGLAHYNKLGFYCKVEVKELSSFVSWKEYQGVISEWSYDVDAEEQLEHCTVTCDAEHA